MAENPEPLRELLTKFRGYDYDNFKDIGDKLEENERNGIKLSEDDLKQKFGKNNEYCQYFGTSSETAKQSMVQLNLKKLNIISSFNVKGSVGMNTGWTRLPWVRIYDYEESPKTDKGRFVAYIRAYKDNVVYLSLNHGTSEGNVDKLRVKVENIRNKIKNKFGFLSDAGINHSPMEKIPKAKQYDAGAILYKKYNLNMNYSEDELENDLKNILNIYSEYILKGTTNSVGDDDESNKNNALIIDNDGFVINSKQYNYDDIVKLSRNRIIYGAPGTGKSFKINDAIEKIYVTQEERNYFTERITFYPDYSYANFVGTYKPVPDEKNKEIITYNYVPGPFIRIYLKAKKNPNFKYILVIEEINRAMVSAVFGDVFQLLDRDDNGNSEYPVHTSEDVRKYLNDIGLKDCDILSLPPNLFIWATMNSADQGVYPLDTAFKRRWDFEYIDININDIPDGEDVNIITSNSGKELSWDEVRYKINTKLSSLKVNEDKLLGYFFISKKARTDNGEFIKEFKNKVLMYLFEDVAKHNRDKLFKGCSNDAQTFSKILEYYDKKGFEIFDKDFLE